MGKVLSVGGNAGPVRWECGAGCFLTAFFLRIIGGDVGQEGIAHSIPNLSTHFKREFIGGDVGPRSSSTPFL